MFIRKGKDADMCCSDGWDTPNVVSLFLPLFAGDFGPCVGLATPARPFSFLESRRVSGANTSISGAQRRELRSVFLLVLHVTGANG